MYLVFLDEGDEGRPLHLHRLSGAVVEGDDEVEEVGLPQVGRRLLLEVGPCDARRDSGQETSATSLVDSPEISGFCKSNWNRALWALKSLMIRSNVKFEVT